MTTPVVVTAIAKQDVRDILTYLHETADYAVARSYGEDFKRAYRDIALWPGSGAPRPALGPNTRIKVVWPYVVIYEHDEARATVLRVLYGRRKITARMIER